MRKHNAENELAKRDYLGWLEHTAGRDPATLDQVIATIHEFEAFNRYVDFKGFRQEQAVSFKAHLRKQTNAKTGKRLGLATLHGKLGTLKAFFKWLSHRPGYRKGALYSDASYFNLTTKEARTATARREKACPSLEQVLHVLGCMPSTTATERRDRALIAFVILTGSRDGAVASMRIKHVDTAAGRVWHDAREVKTKGAKSYTSNFFPIDDLPRRIVLDWIAELETQHLFGPDDPLFPPNQISLDEQGLFAVTGLSRTAWTSAAPIREVFRKAFESAGLPYFNPHSLRSTLMREAYRRDLTVRELKAWSQNLAHDGVLTSLVSYGALTVDEQSEIMTSLGKGRADGPKDSAEVLDQIKALLHGTKPA